jgi:hypothetical protein
MDSHLVKKVKPWRRLVFPPEGGVITAVIALILNCSFYALDQELHIEIGERGIAGCTEKLDTIG